MAYLAGREERMTTFRALRHARVFSSAITISLLCQLGLLITGEWNEEAESR